MSLSSRPLRSSSVTSSLKVRPPRVSSRASATAASLWMAHCGSAADSSASCSSETSMLRMLSIRSS